MIISDDITYSMYDLTEKYLKWKPKVFKNMILHFYVYWIGVTTRDDNNLDDVVNKLNNCFTKPLKQTKVDAILIYVSKAIDKFLNYER